MLVIHATNVNDAYAEALFKINIIGEVAGSRNGKVMRAPYPVVTVYEKPTQRMLFDAERDANPFFHIMEGIWMLAGRRDVKWIERFNSKIGQYSDDGKTFHGAYGRRWRHSFGYDQIVFVIDELKRNPNSRRAVIAMWNPTTDIPAADEGGKDLPCNTTIYFNRRENFLNMTVCNRSNDIIWGCYGANAVHMSMLQEFIADALGLHCGQYYQFSNDWHMYEPHFHLSGKVPQEPFPYPLVGVSLTTSTTWEQDLMDLASWTADYNSAYASPYIDYVLEPMLEAWFRYKEGNLNAAIEVIKACRDVAVRNACTLWLMRRVK